MADITIIGNLTRDPEMRFTPGGQSVTSFGVAENRRWKDREGEWQEHTTYWNCQAWGDLGENVAQSLAKGARVIVKGRVESRDYETNEGEKRTVFDVTAYNVGPDLSYATAEVTKIERYKQEDGEPATSKTAPKRQTSKARAEDEEPF